MPACDLVVHRGNWCFIFPYFEFSEFQIRSCSLAMPHQIGGSASQSLPVLEDLAAPDIQLLSFSE